MNALAELSDHRWLNTRDAEPRLLYQAPIAIKKGRRANGQGLELPEPCRHGLSIEQHPLFEVLQQAHRGRGRYDNASLANFHDYDGGRRFAREEVSASVGERV